MSDRRVFVAGSATMTGQAIVRQVGREGLTVVGIEDEPDLRDNNAVDRFLRAARPDYVIIAAGKTAGIAGNQKYPADLMLDNLLVAAHLIPGAWRNGVTRLLYIASSCTYPREAEQPLKVASLWNGPLEPTSSAYAVAKLAGVRLCEAYRQQHGARFITAIQSDVFGPGDDFSEADSHVVAALLRRMHDAKLAAIPVVEIWGSGAPLREFIYVDDLADACVFLLNNYDGSSPINIGTGVMTSITELAEMVRRVVGYKGELRFDKSKPDGMLRKGLDSSPLRALGWKPSWDLQAGLMKTYEWVEEHVVPAQTQEQPL